MTTIPNPDAELLRRVVNPEAAGWSAEAEQSLLALSFSQAIWTGRLFWGEGWHGRDDVGGTAGDGGLSQGGTLFSIGEIPCTVVPDSIRI